MEKINKNDICLCLQNAAFIYHVINIMTNTYYAIFLLYDARIFYLFIYLFGSK